MFFNDRRPLRMGRKKPPPEPAAKPAKLPLESTSLARLSSCGHCGSNAVTTAGSATGNRVVCRQCGRVS